MSDNGKEKKSTSSSTYNGNFSGFTGGVGNTGQVTGTQTVYNSPERKTCRGCLSTVGADHQGNCQCEQKDNYCEWCEEGKGLRKNCLCKKQEFDQKSEVSSVHLKNTKEESVREKENTEVSKTSVSAEIKSQNQPFLLQENDKEIISAFLKAKMNFLSARQATIEQLRSYWSELEKSDASGKHAIIGEIGNVISNTGTSVGSITFGVPKAVGEIIIASNNFSKAKSFEKNGKEFQIFLVGDENELSQLENAYKSLNDITSDEKEIKDFVGSLKPKKGLASEKIDFFGDNKYKILNVLVNDNILVGKVLKAEKMEEAAISLEKNLDKLWKDLDQQFEELEKNNNLGKEIASDWKKENLPKRIEFKKTELEALVKSATKDKLKSKKQERNEARQKLLDELKGADNEDKLASIKKDILKTKDNWDKNKSVVQLIENLCRVRRELTELQVELENLQNQQPQQQALIQHLI